MAAPQVAGTAAKMLSANPRLSSNTVKMALQFTARVLPRTDTLAQGAGALNAIGAVQLARIINPGADRGEPWLMTALPKYNLDENRKTVIWSQRLVWGDRFMPASTASVHMARWDDNIVWGFDTLADNIVWGNDWENIVWGNCAMARSSDDNIVWGNSDDNIVWGFNDDNIVWGFNDGDNIVWGNNCAAKGPVSNGGR